MPEFQLALERAPCSISGWDQGKIFIVPWKKKEDKSIDHPFLMDLTMTTEKYAWSWHSSSLMITRLGKPFWRDEITLMSRTKIGRTLLNWDLKKNSQRRKMSYFFIFFYWFWFVCSLQCYMVLYYSILVVQKKFGSIFWLYNDHLIIKTTDVGSQEGTSKDHEEKKKMECRFSFTSYSIVWKMESYAVMLLLCYNCEPYYDDIDMNSMARLVDLMYFCCDILFGSSHYVVVGTWYWVLYNKWWDN